MDLIVPLALSHSFIIRLIHDLFTVLCMISSNEFKLAFVPIATIMGRFHSIDEGVFIYSVHKVVRAVL